MYKIVVENLKEMVEVSASLVKEGICFVVHKKGEAWEIQMTGGY